MEQKIITKYENLLKSELIPALGCTEPGAVGFVAAKSMEVLGQLPERIELYCSANIIKNVKSVNVPNSGGMKGIEAAAILAILSGDPSDSLEIFNNVKKEDINKTKELIQNGFCKVYLQEGEGNLYVRAVSYAGTDVSEVIIKDTHTNIIKIVSNGNVLLEKSIADKNENTNKDFLTIKGIIEFAEAEDWKILKDIMKLQREVNTAIAEEGVLNTYGANVGKTLLGAYGSDIKIRAKAKAAAGSDARMGGSPLPVVINSGSGNQGITLTVPVVEYAEEFDVSEEKLYRALAISNLISIHIKSMIGKLSAFCGAVSASCGCGAAISYMFGGGYEQICDTITNTLANVGGIICDGAKASCAAKIAASVDAAILGHEMAKRNRKFQGGEGIVADDIEETIKNFGIVGREGMHETDISIMKLMIGC